MMNRTLNTQKQSQEILSWFSDDGVQRLDQRSYTYDRCTMPFRNCTYGFLAVPMIVPQSLNPQRSKDTSYTLDEVTVNFEQREQKQLSEIPLCIESNESEYLNVLLHGGRLSLYRALNYLNG